MLKRFTKKVSQPSTTVEALYVMDPGGVKSESPATVFGLRCRIKF